MQPLPLRSLAETSTTGKRLRSGFTNSPSDFDRVCGSNSDMKKSKDIIAVKHPCRDCVGVWGLGSATQICVLGYDWYME